ncbi:MAG TPA: hypothetical protein VHD38_01870 [Candidatus Paceibacterota bacterium]|nr:hypothetical protein [Candidatus Paceibacterota bacterium]
MPAAVAQRQETGRERLESYFTVPSGRISDKPIGMEVETSFLNEEGKPISIQQSQAIFKTLVDHGWNVTQMKGSLISTISDRRGNKLLYEVGRQNLEIATLAGSRQLIIHECRDLLERLYVVAKRVGAYPLFKPIVDTTEDLLVIPDERDAIWDQLDGREALKMIAWMSAVQFTVEIPADKAIDCINRLGCAIDDFLADYPQDKIWRDYIATSKADYRSDRYGGPLAFADLRHYCAEIAKHDVVVGPKLVPFDQVANLDIPLHLRSVWWYFRLRRYGDRLCIEVRPLPRRADSRLQNQLNFVLETLAL